MRPSFVDEIFIHSDDHRVLYLNPVAPDWITINENYRPIFNLIDGTCDEEDIYYCINNNFPKEKEILIPQIKEILYSSNIFKTNYKPISKHNLRIDKPKNICLTLTDNCNLHCVYCYAEERKKTKNSTFEEWYRYVTSIINFVGSPVFTYTGGEPLTVPYILKLAEYTKKQQCENILLTNGTLITNENVEKITKAFDLVKISLDSIDETISKDLRGSGIVEKVKNAFALLKNAGCNVQIMATVTAKSLNNLKDFFIYFDTQVIFQPLYSIGRARTADGLGITGEQYYNALTKDGKFSFLHSYIDSIKSFKNNPLKRCSMANDEISIDQNGNIYPCHMMHYEKFICGNLNDQSIEDIYLNSPLLEKLRMINVDNLPQCKVCVFRNFCGGACRARNDIMKFGIEEHNDFCKFEQKEILDALMYSYG